MKFKLKTLFACLLLAGATQVSAQAMPTTDRLGTVTGNIPNTWQTYSFNYTPVTTGANYVGFAFREDPAFWSLRNASLSTGGGSNLLLNGSMADGGSINITTNNGPSTINAPTSWGVWYQNGTYPAAAGTWMNSMWYDGAVGSYDGIYQGVNLTSGITYTLSFSVSGNNIANGSSIGLGAYGGTCGNASIAANLCTIPSTAGFTTLATPSQGEAATSNPTPPTPTPPAAPTVVSTAAGPDRLVSTGAAVIGAIVVGDVVSTTRGQTAVAVTNADARGAQTSQTLAVTRTTTAVSTTPITVVRATRTPTTVTSIYQPTVVDTLSDGTTVERDSGSTVTRSAAGVDVIGTQTANITETLTARSNNTYTTRVDQNQYLEQANQRFNQQLDSNPLDRHDIKGPSITSKTGDDDRDAWAYIIADGQKSNTNIDGYSMNATRFGVGYEKAVEHDLLVGIQFNNISSTLNGNNAGGSLNKNHVGIYSLSTWEDWILKSDIGLAFNQYTNYHSIPQLGMSNNGSASGADAWFNNRLYTLEMAGFRPFAGVRVETNRVSAFTEGGTSLTSMSYSKVNQSNTSGEAGLRFEEKLFDEINVIAEASQNTNSLTTLKAGLGYSPDKAVLGLVNVGQQRQSGITNNILQASVKVLF